MPQPRAARLVALSLLLLALSGCAVSPVDPAGDAAGARIAQLALAEVGQPYRHGSDGDGGFDCSGLTAAVHARSGIVIPRTAAAQRQAGHPVARDALRPGDLVFFRFGGRRVDHVGVYVGNGEFVHAPRAGATVRRVALTAPWFAQRYAGAARYWRD